jgi:hypothetical protein
MQRKEVNRMNKHSEKREYTKPAVTDHGTLQELTAQGGVNFTDVAIGTPNTGPGSVTGSTP